jgi:hypothetical protein
MYVISTCYLKSYHYHKGIYTIRINGFQVINVCYVGAFSTKLLNFWRGWAYILIEQKCHAALNLFQNQ